MLNPQSAAPVRDALGRVVAALSAGGPKYRLTRRRLESIAAMLGESAAKIQRELGG